MAMRSSALRLAPYAHRAMSNFAPQFGAFGNANLDEIPSITMVRGEGLFMYDDQGKEYLDGLAGLWCLNLGSSEQRLKDAAARQLERLPYFHNFWGRRNDAAQALAEKVVGMSSHLGISRAMFVGSGSEANDTQIKLAWYYHMCRGEPSRRKILSRRKGYHGVTIGGAAVGGIPALHAGFGLPEGLPFAAPRLTTPHYWREGRPGESEEQFSARLADELDAAIREEGPETVAAFIGEPLMGAGGVMPPPKGYWDGVQRVLRDHGVLLIADEVVTGFGRLGTMFGCDYYGIRPDLVSVAKGLSSGYVPIGASLISEQVASVVGQGANERGVFGHGFTYGGHPVGCAVATEALSIYEERDIPGHVAGVAPGFQGEMRRLGGESPIVGEARGVGLIAALELARSKETKEAFPAEWGVGQHLASAALRRGLIVRNIGDVIALSPPLVAGAADLAEMARRLAGALGESAEYAEGRAREAAA